MAVKVKLTKKKRAKRSQRREKAEVTRLGAALRTLGGLGGGAIGSLVGMPSSGAGVGTSLGAALSKWLGSGDYSVGTNSIVSRTMKGSDSVPSMHKTSQSVVIRHKEFIGEVRGAGVFTVRDSLQLNPGNGRTFPWLSTIATGFQEYRFKGVVFHYVPSSGNAISGTNAALGTVMLQTSYRANDSAPASKVELLNEYWSSESVPSEPFCHPIECDPKENPFNVMYVRSGEIPAGDNQLFYDLGTTHVCVSGQQSTNNVLGDLWVTYEVELKKPIVASNVTPRSLSFEGTYSGIMNGLTWFNGTVESVGNLAIKAETRTVTFPEGAVGTWLLMVTMTPVTFFTTVDLGAVPSVSNATLNNILPGINYIQSKVGTATNLQRLFCAAVITITDPAVQAIVTFPASTITGDSITSTLLVVPGIAV